MDSRLISNLCLVLISLSFLGCVCLGADDTKTAEQMTFPDFPYFARITGDNVYVRSGPGTNYYRCTKLNQGDMVKVVSRENAWSRIVPTETSFSWISKQYVFIDASNPDIGIVTVDKAYVYAGSEYIEPIHSEEVQLTLNKGDKVNLLGEEVGDYYKIAPVAGTYFWVSTQFIKPVDVTKAQVQEVKPEAVPRVEEQAKPELKLPEEMKSVVTTSLPENTERLKKYYKLQDIVKAEYTRPLSEQDYSTAKQNLNDLIGADKDDKAALYAEYLLSQIKRFELAADVERESKLQNSQLDRTIRRIENARSQRASEFKDYGRYAVIGKIKESSVYGPEVVLLHYTVVDRDNKIICYALPAGAAGHTNLDEYVGKKIGLIGIIEPHPQTSGALVRFSGIEIID
ncbi:MAG: SH3 domain-containing protein [Sedimentisphaerales bacterium]|nr:SH3 domain-containing protein [Sedimentisphaerales bacterium]